jgi:hypothetical protein
LEFDEYFYTETFLVVLEKLFQDKNSLIFVSFFYSCPSVVSTRAFDHLVITPAPAKLTAE